MVVTWNSRELGPGGPIDSYDHGGDDNANN